MVFHLQGTRKYVTNAMAPDWWAEDWLLRHRVMVGANLNIEPDLEKCRMRTECWSEVTKRTPYA